MRSSTLSVAGDTTVNATSAVSEITVSSNDTASTKLVVASGDSNISIKIDGNLISLTSMATMGDITAGLVSGINALTGITATVANGSEITFTKDATFDLSTNAKAQAFITTFDTAIKTVNTQRATLGAISNRLDNSVSNLTNTAVNLEAGKGRIEDADFAAETTNLARTQILQQASTAMLAQANASKQNVLSLLQG